MQKIVINKCYGGFGLSAKAEEMLGFGQYDEPFTRDHPKLVEVVETLGEHANGSFADLKVVEVPDGVEWAIEEYDGIEWIAKKHQTWG